MRVLFRSLRRRTRQARSEEGGSLVEIAFVILFFGVLLSGAVELSSAIFAYIELQGAAHAAATAVEQAYSSSTAASIPSQTVLQNLAINETPKLQGMLLNGSSNNFGLALVVGCSTLSGSTMTFTTTTASTTPPTCTSPALPYAKITVTATIQANNSFSGFGAISNMVLPGQYTMTSTAFTHLAD